MPPFCAPSSSHLLDEAPASSPSPEETEDDDRAQMVASLVTALAEAEAAAAEESNTPTPEQQHHLASQAYTSLCFDFPIVSTNALEALANAFRSSSLGTGAPLFPITEKFTSGLRYLVSIEFTKQSSLDGVVATEDVGAERQGESLSDSKFRCTRLFELYGCVFLLAPALRLAVAHKDGGASLQAFFASYDSSPADLFEQRNEFEDAMTSGTDLDINLSNAVGTCERESEDPSTVHDDVAEEMDGDDSDWEALENFTPPLLGVISEQRTIPRHGEKVAWSELIDKVALLTQSVPSEVINTGIWGDLQLTKHLILALNGMRMLERMETEFVASPIAKLCADLLVHHLLSSLTTTASEVTEVLSALMVLVEADGENKQRSSSMAVRKKSGNAWNLLALSTLAKICAEVGGYPAKEISSNSNSTAPCQQSVLNGFKKRGLLPSSTFVRNLWQSVFSSLQFLKEQLTEAQGAVGSFSQLEMVLWVLCFMVKYAPGNIDLRATLLEEGIFRIALQLYVEAGGEPNMEPLRHFLLLSMNNFTQILEMASNLLSSPCTPSRDPITRVDFKASCAALAEFAAQVSSFTSAISAAGHCSEGSYAKAHAAIWPLILRAASTKSSTSKSPIGNLNLLSTDVEGDVTAAFDEIVEAVADDKMKTKPFAFLKKLVWLHILLSLLEDATSVSSISTFKLWRRRSPLDISIGRCQAAFGSLLVHVTDKAVTTSPRLIAHQKKSEDLQDNRVSEKIPDDSTTTSASDESKERSVLHSDVQETELVAAQEKLKELLPSLLLQLKLLSALTKENRETKID